MSSKAATVEPKKKGFKVPHTYVILFVLIIITCILTYIIPAGKYENVAGGTQIDPTSFHLIDAKPAGVGEFMLSFMGGMMTGANTIMVCLFIGGAFQILMDTGSVDAILGAIIDKSKGRFVFVFPAVMFFMAILGAVGVGNNVALAFVPILIPIAKRLKLDAMSIAAVLLIGSNTGFTNSPLNPFTVLLSQNIAQIPQMSGMLVRCIQFVLFVSFGIWYTLRYCTKIQKDPSKAYTPILSDKDDSGKSVDFPKLTTMHIINFVVLIVVFAIYAWGGTTMNWSMNHLGACMIAMLIIIGVINRFSMDGICDALTKGAETMLAPSLIIGLASSISVIMQDANIVHSIVYYATLPLQGLSAALSAIGMYVINFIIAIPISSGSGQARIVMPIMAPAADVLGISRQVAISAYQFADGWTNFITPTNGLNMGTIALCGVAYTKWLKFISKYMLYTTVLSCIFLVIVTLLNWQ